MFCVTRHDLEATRHTLTHCTHSSGLVGTLPVHSPRAALGGDPSGEERKVCDKSGVLLSGDWGPGATNVNSAVTAAQVSPRWASEVRPR